MFIARKIVGVFPPAELQRRQSTFDCLAEIVPVKFVPFSPEKASLPDACIFLGQDHPVAQRQSVPSYVWEDRPSCSSPADSARVEFSSWPGLHPAIRNQRLSESGSRQISCTSLGDGDVVLAKVEDRPVWKVRGTSHYATVEPPCLKAGELLWGHFLPDRWLGLLPLLQFLKLVCKDISWQESAPPACFIFDDPNLHALDYGYLDFPRMAREAQERRYHVAIATVPMDSWYVNPKVARLFQEQSKYISLTTHGCEHTKRELIGRRRDHLPLLAQALQRVEKLEARTQLKVARMMVPPHSACSEAVMDLMLRLGYEGGCLDAANLLRWNQDKKWPSSFGLGNVLWMGAGFPVSYRLKITPDIQTKIRLAAFLGQPILVYGHHNDCAFGMENLGRISDTVNGLGGHWDNLISIMRAHYKTRIEGALLRTQICSRRISMKIPEHITHVSIERPWMHQGDLEVLVCRGNGNSIKNFSAGPVTDPIEVNPGSEITVCALPNESIDYRSLRGPRVRIWPTVRRGLVEARDRLQPIVNRKSHT